MSSSTVGIINGHISVDKIMDYIKEKYDTNATNDISKGNYGLINYARVLYGNEAYIEGGFICFRDKDFINKDLEHRMLYYFYSSTNSYENEEIYIKYDEIFPGVINAIYDEGTSISLGCDERAKDIIKDMVENLGGGWLDDNDCDDIPYKKINPINDFKPTYSKKTLIFNPDKE